jgi:hypothetical protein
LGFLAKKVEQEPGICTLYRQHENFVYHLFVGCHFTKEVCVSYLTLMNDTGKSEGDSFSNALKAWCEDKDFNDNKVFTIAIQWAIMHSQTEINLQNSSFTLEHVCT